MNQSLRPLLWVAAAMLLACGGDPPVTTDDAGPADTGGDVDASMDADAGGPPCEVRLADEDGGPFDLLSEYCFFRGELADHDPMPGVVLYDVTAPLYSDRSEKKRFLVLPEGETIGFELTDHWSWPDDTIIVKTFYYHVDRRDPAAGEQILETRLLIKREGSWQAQSYIWDEEQQEAHRNNLGRRVDLSFIDDDGSEVEIDYRIPNQNQCRTCHGQDGDLVPLGPRTFQLTESYAQRSGEPTQLEHFEELGLFDSPLPDPETFPTITHYYDESADLEDRARSYLDANCAHCHNPKGRAASSNLHLGIDITDERKLGVCKFPVAAGSGAGGLTYDIVPGHPEESIMIYRMDSTDAAIKMPELPLTTIDHFGVDLISEWILQMEPTGCN